jgi:hypothetical protein
MESSFSRIIETEVDVDTGIVVERHGPPEPPPSRKRGIWGVVAVCALAGLLTGLAAGWLPSPPPASRSGPPEVLGTDVKVAALRSSAAFRGLDAYRGLGVWARAENVDASAVAGLVGRGVRTLFVEVADPVSSGGTPDPGVAAELLVAAHRRGLRVVAWYRPTGRGIATNLTRLAAIASFAAAGERFDGVAVDLTTVDPADEGDVAASVELSRGLREAVGEHALAAVVHPRALPSAELSALYDVWVLVAGAAPAEEVAALRAALGQPAAVHLRDGLSGGEAAAGQLLDAAAATHALGVSAGDYRATPNDAFDALAAGAPPDGFGEEGLHE